jgi:hypothetical protein
VDDESDLRPMRILPIEEPTEEPTLATELPPVAGDADE